MAAYLPFRAGIATLLVSSSLTAFAQYQQTNLVSDGSVPAAHIDAKLGNAWGLAFSPTGPFWIADNHSSVATVYAQDGTPFPFANPLVVNVPPTASSPTGLVFNDRAGFNITLGQVTKPSTFIFATEDGVLSGWNSDVDLHNAVMTVDNRSSGAVYKGAALGTIEERHGRRTQVLYVTNFNSGFVEAYDTDFHMLGQFTDEHVPAGYAPFGIHNIEGLLVVTFALQDSAKHDDVKGPGNGFVDLFSTRGQFLARFASGGALNSPWGVALAPGHFGKASHRLLIGNFGDGRINAFDRHNGHLRGALKDAKGDPISIDGLWSIKFGNGHLAGSKDKLFFTAGPNGEANGLFGSLAVIRHDHDDDDDDD